MTTVWLRPLGQAWQAVGTYGDRGAWHEGLTLVSDQVGPKTADFRLQRPPRGLHPDLLADTPVIVEAGGVRAWSGRIKDTPESSGPARQIDVQCDGWQAHLDDDAYERVYVHTKLADWKDMRSTLTAALGSGSGGNFAAGQISTDNGILLTVPAGTAIPVFGNVGVILDLGASAVLAKRVVVDWESSNNDAATEFRVDGVDDPTRTGAVNAFAVTLTAATGLSSGTLSANKRYVIATLHDTGSGHTPSADVWLRIKSIQVFTDTAYESGGASILTADVGIKDALARATTLFSGDLSGIGTPSPTFPFPDFAPSDPQTPREVIAAFNAAHNWRFKIDEYQRASFSARPTVSVVEFGSWPGNESDGGSSNNADGICTKAIVRGTGPDGSPISVTRSQTGTIVDRQGGGRTQILSSSFALNTALANQLGDTYLASHRTSPFKGTVTVTPGGARRVLGGASLHPAHLLLLTGELARRADLIDPDTGAAGRNVTIDQVTYRDDDLAAEVALDNTRNDWQALLERLGLLVPA